MCASQQCLPLQSPPDTGTPFASPYSRHRILCQWLLRGAALPSGPQCPTLVPGPAPETLRGPCRNSAATCSQNLLCLAGSTSSPPGDCPLFFCEFSTLLEESYLAQELVLTALMGFLGFFKSFLNKKSLLKFLLSISDNIK